MVDFAIHEIFAGRKPKWYNRASLFGGLSWAIFPGDMSLKDWAFHIEGNCGFRRRGHPGINSNFYGEIRLVGFTITIGGLWMHGYRAINDWQFKH